MIFLRCSHCTNWARTFGLLSVFIRKKRCNLESRFKKVFYCAANKTFLSSRWWHESLRFLEIMNNIKLLNYLLGKLPAGSGFILNRQTREWRPSSHPTPCWNVNKCLSQKLLNYSFNYLYTLHTIKHTHGDTLVRSRVSLLKSTTDHKAHTGPLSLSLSLSRRSDVSPLGCLKSYTWLNW